MNCVIPNRNEGRDGYDSVACCAAQDWCDGKVATMGGSYLRHMQWLTVLQQPPHLETMIVLVTPSDPFVEWPTGTPSPMHLCWFHLISGRMNQVMEAVGWNKVYEHLPLMTMDEEAGRVNPLWREELQHTRLDDYWEPLSYQDKFDQIDLPVMHISGWYGDEQIGTPLLEAYVEVIGPVRLGLYASSSTVDTDFTAKLVDVNPSGFVQRLCDGIVRARFRNDMRNPQLIEPGKAYQYEIDLWNTAQVFFKGHRIGLEVSSSAFPKLDRNSLTAI